MAARRAAAAVAAVALLLALQCADLAQAASARRSMRVSSTGALPATKFSRSLQQLPKPASVQIGVTGVLQSATVTVDPTCRAASNCGGTMTVNGQVIVVPVNAMVFFPANALTWFEIFSETWTGSGVWKSNLAMSDPPSPSGTTYIVTITANRVNGVIIAALIDITQAPLVSGQGFIESIDYLNGELTIEGARVRINDPTGRYGKAQVGAPFDDRFCVDPDNPTIRSETGFPMCIPRYDPAQQEDYDCPSYNRPIDPQTGYPATNFQMYTPGSAYLDPMKQAPFAVGDYVTYAGVVVEGNAFFSAYEIVNNVAIYTSDGVDPAYVSWEAALIGTGGVTALGLAEATTRSRFEGFTTDSSRPIQIWGLDFNPADGSVTKIPFGQVMPDPGPLAAPGARRGAAGAVRGRWRFRPPCVNFPTVDLDPNAPFLGNRGCTPPPGGVYKPVREVMASVMGCQPQYGAGNGLTSGDADTGFGGCHYRNPSIEFLWPENVPGARPVENNFQSMEFLSLGGYKSSKGTITRTLRPWPSATPVFDCDSGPSLSSGGPYTCTKGGSVTLTVAATGVAAPFRMNWSGDAATGATCTMISDTAASCSPVSASGWFTVTVWNKCGKSFTKSEWVEAVEKQVVQAITPLTVKSGTLGLSFSARTSSGASLPFSWAPMADSTDLVIKTQSANPAALSTITFDAPVIPFGTITNTVYRVQVTAGSWPATSDPTIASLTVTPLPDALTVPTATMSYTCTKKILIVNAVSNINNKDLRVFLQPYKTSTGVMFDPLSLASNELLWGGAGTYSITLVGAPKPSTTQVSIWVQSSIGGFSTKVALPPIRVTGTC